MDRNSVRLSDEIDARDPRRERDADDDGRVTVLLACDSVPGRAGVRHGLERHGFSIVAEAEDVTEAFEAARRYRPQVCLLDVDMPGGGGIAAADWINAELPATRIAILSAQPRPDQLRDAILAGADGYLPRSTAPDRLTAALNSLVNGEVVLPPALTGELVREFRASAQRLVAAPATSTADLADFRIDVQPLAQRSRLLYVPRLYRHYRRRRRSGMPPAVSWMSARVRMGDYE
jgi:DNA-binding NarL/FixJ family response regulator